MDYWHECIAEACSEAGIVATDEQIATVASWVEGAHENYSQAHGYDVIGNPMISENDRLQRELELERSKVMCKECNGTGQLVSHGPHHSGISQCHKCRGEGRHSL